MIESTHQRNSRITNENNGWANQRQHDEAVASGHAEYRINNLLGNSFSISEHTQGAVLHFGKSYQTRAEAERAINKMKGL